jgi:hypothetical protein
MQNLSAAGLEVTFTPGKIEVSTEDENKSKLRSLDAGDVSWREKAITRSIKNVGDVRFEAVDIEIK